jgi:UDP-N-acetylmuramoyl-tripeptide--D-alanyl-D-alanine ligase
LQAAASQMLSALDSHLLKTYAVLQIMKELSITDLAKILNATCDLRATSSEPQVTGVSIDSRTVKAGDCFFAIAGENHDGHNFLANSFAKGAICAVVSDDNKIRNLQSEIRNKLILKVDDTIKALGVLSAWFRKNCNFKVVAITGSVGKTTTRQILYHILSRRFKTHQPVKNFNNHIGLPLTLLAAPPDCQIVITELGTNHPGEIENLTKIASPDIALVTTVAPAHLEGFGGLETLTNEKLSISKGLDSNGTLILNGDCPDLIALAKAQNKKFLTFGLKPDCDYRLENFSSDGLSSKFEISNIEVHLPLPGLGNANNALAAWAVADQFQIALADFADALKTITPVSMRTEILNVSSLTIINDCYNANPASMKNALDILTTLSKNQNRRAVFICGDMAELGDQTEKLHIELGKQITESNVSLLLTVGNLSLIAADTAKNESPALEAHSFLSVEQLCDNLHRLIRDSDIILVKGSRINKLELAIEKLKTLIP